MARATRLTADAKKARRRRVVCGHFSTYNCRVYCAEGVFDQSICKQCGKNVEQKQVHRDAPPTYD